MKRLLMFTVGRPSSTLKLRESRAVPRVVRCRRKRVSVAMDQVRLSADPIDHARVLDEVRTSAAGAVVLFLGTVREFTGDVQTVRMEYDAYTDMAVAKLWELARETRARWPVAKISVQHRTGLLELGEVSVAVAVSSAHRQDAFEAGRHLIDRLKEVVPIWKKEHFPDGSTDWIHPDAPPVQPE
ncbi:MAG: molybdenum cofactor biosynthesis protein MoaE [Planctomycetaceae bacterium]